MDTVIEVKELHRLFGNIRAVDGLTFDVQPGEVFGLLGPNGAGKTTTVRLLNGILPPSSGSLRRSSGRRSTSTGSSSPAERT